MDSQTDTFSKSFAPPTFFIISAFLGPFFASHAAALAADQG
jgi:hypothetical protein